MRSVKLNAEQQLALSVYMEEYDLRSGVVEVSIDRGQLVVDKAYLHADGEWATYPEGGEEHGEHHHAGVRGEAEPRAAGGRPAAD